MSPYRAQRDGKVICHHAEFSLDFGDLIADSSTPLHLFDFLFVQHRFNFIDDLVFHRNGAGLES